MVGKAGGGAGWRGRGGGGGEDQKQSWAELVDQRAEQAGGQVVRDPGGGGKLAHKAHKDEQR